MTGQLGRPAGYTNPTERIAVAVEKLAEEQRRQTEVLERIAAALEDEDSDEAEESERTFEGLIDYRQETRENIPEKCRVCGGEVQRTMVSGEIDVRTSDDIKSMGVPGLAKPGRYRTIWWEWRCVADLNHEYGPIDLVGQGLVSTRGDKTPRGV